MTEALVGIVSFGTGIKMLAANLWHTLSLWPSAEGGRMPSHNMVYQFKLGSGANHKWVPFSDRRSWWEKQHSCRMCASLNWLTHLACVYLWSHNWHFFLLLYFFKNWDAKATFIVLSAATYILVFIEYPGNENITGYWIGLWLISIDLKSKMSSVLAIRASGFFKLYDSVEQAGWS